VIIGVADIDDDTVAFSGDFTGDVVVNSVTSSFLSTNSARRQNCPEVSVVNGNAASRRKRPFFR